MAVNKIFGITLDTKTGLTNRQFTVVEGDNGNKIDIEVVDDNAPVSLEGCLVLAVFAKPTGTSSQGTLEEDGGGIIVDGNHVLIDLYTSSFSVGTVECELQIYSGEDNDTLITTAKFNFNCRAGIFNDETVQSTNEYPVLVQLIRQVEDMSHGIPWLPSAEAGNAVFVGTEGRLESKGPADAREALEISPVNIGAAPAPVIRTGTLLSSGWTSGVQTVTISGVSAGSKGSIALPGSATKAQREAARAAQLFLTEQGENSITVTADGTVPSIDIPFAVLIVG